MAIGAEAHQILQHEEAFHNEWANSTDPESVCVDEVANACTMPETRYILQELDRLTDHQLAGKAVLEIGCGCGEAAVYFAKQGMRVTATDASKGMLNLTQKVADLHGASLETCQCPAESLPFADGSFDIVYAANVLHHVDIPTALAEAHRVLRKGGLLIAWDPIKYNPAINVYRKKTPTVRTPDEHPVDKAYVRQIQNVFTDHKVRLKGFWLATTYIFAKYYFFDKVNPNEERYWKKVVTEHKQLEPLYRRLERIDRGLLFCMPFLKWICWNMVIIVEK